MKSSSSIQGVQKEGRTSMKSSVNPWKKMATLIKDENTKHEIQNIIIDRFKLSCMSDNNSYFLFEDKLSQSFKVYYLKNVDKEIELIGKSLSLKEH